MSDHGDKKSNQGNNGKIEFIVFVPTVDVNYQFMVVRIFDIRISLQLVITNHRTPSMIGTWLTSTFLNLKKYCVQLLLRKQHF